MAETEQTMQASALERRFTPLKRSAPKYDVTRLRVQTRAAELTEQSSTSEPRAGVANATSRYGYELRVKSDDGLIAGRIDRAVATPSGTTLQDYKSGAIFSLQVGDTQQVKPEYALQLHLYAALYHDTTGSWPDRLELVPLTGTPQNVMFSQDACRTLLNRAKGLLAAVNAKLQQSHTLEGIEATLATPLLTACRFCAFRPACSPYLSAEKLDDETDTQTWPPDAWGSFSSLTKLGNGRYVLRAVQSDGTQLFVRDLDGEVVGASLHSVEQGMFVGAFNLMRTRLPHVYESGPLTTVYCRTVPIQTPPAAAPFATEDLRNRC